MRCKILILTAFLIIFNGFAAAKEVAVKIKPEYKITTSNLDLKEGDILDFTVCEDVFVKSAPYIKKGQKVTGMVTSIQDNDYLVTPAKIYIENFRTHDVNNSPVKLKGIVYKSGNDHHVICEFIILELFRGGEVQIKPQKDVFTIYAEENL